MPDANLVQVVITRTVAVHLQQWLRVRGSRLAKIPTGPKEFPTYVEVDEDAVLNQDVIRELERRATDG